MSANLSKMMEKETFCLAGWKCDDVFSKFYSRWGLLVLSSFHIPHFTVTMVNLWILSTALSCTVTASFQRATTTHFSRRSLTIMASGDVQAYFQRQKFCVVGASTGMFTATTSFVSYLLLPYCNSDRYCTCFFQEDQTKFGNKVLRCYMQHNYAVVPINKKSKEIEGLECIPSLTEWVTTAAVECPSDLGVSIVTPPGVTKGIIEEGYRLGNDHILSFS